MAKGRKLTISRSERYLGTYASHSHSTGAPLNSSELCEEDVWSTLDGDYDYYAPGSEWDSHASDTPRIPRRERHVGGLSLAFEESSRTTSSRIVHQFRAQDGVVSSGSQTRRPQRHMATSAPMNVPDWGKILRVDSVDMYLEDECDSALDPPHEYLARSRNSATTSVFEGVGRTLKGRDMSRLRDAVWSQTGFDG